MATADIAELVVRIKADAAQLSAEMNKVNALVKQASSGIQQNNSVMASSFSMVKSQLAALAPAISAVAFVGLAKSAFNAADRMTDLADQIGFSAQTLSALNIPLLTADSNVEQFAASINKMSNIIGEAARGESKSLVDTFNMLGINVEKLLNLSPEEQFFAISKALNEIQNQAKFTNAGMEIFGRSFSALAPVIRQNNGELGEFVKQAQATGKALTPEQLKTIGDFGDNWTKTIEEIKIEMLAFIPVLDFLVNRFNDLKSINPIELASKAGAALGEKLRTQITGLPPNASFNRPSVPSDEELARGIAESLKKKTSLSGTNKLITEAKAQQKAIDDAKKSLADFNKELQRQRDLVELTPEAQAGQEIYYRTIDLAQKAQIKNAEQLANKNRVLAEEIYKVREAQAEAARTAELMRDSLSSALTDAIVDFNSAGDAAKNFARAIASTIVQKQIADPLASAIVGNGSKGSGLLSAFSNFLPSFDVGSPYVPNDMVAKIHKGEMIIPKIQADAIRSGSGGGSGVTVVQNINIASGVTRQEVEGILPTVAKAAHDAVFASIQRGGSAAKIVGVR